MLKYTFFYKIEEKWITNFEKSFSSNHIEELLDAAMNWGCWEGNKKLFS